VIEQRQEGLHQQNYKNLFGLLALSGTFSIVNKMERGNKYYKFDKLTIYSGVY
jgi:hypothetical protein